MNSDTAADRGGVPIGPGRDVVLAAPPSLAPLYARAVAGSRRRRTPELTERAVVVASAPVDADRVARAAAAGHAEALPVVEESARHLARALVSVTNLLDLDQIILAGPGFGAAGEIYLRHAQRDLERLSFVRAVHPTTVSLSRFSDVSAALGAATLVLHSRLTPHQTSSRLALAH